MKVARIRIRDILGIESLEFEPGRLTVLQGPNAVGKTSVLEAIKAAIGGGHDARLIRQGAEFGETVLVLDDGTEIKRRITGGASRLTVSQGGVPRGQPQRWLDQVIDGLGFNPLRFLTAAAKERRELLLQALQVTIAIPGAEPMALDEAEALRGRVFAERTQVNRAITETQGLVEGLCKQIPAKAPEEGGEWAYSKALEALEQGRRDYHAAREAALAKLEAEWAPILETLQENVAALHRLAQDAARIEEAQRLHARAQEKLAGLQAEAQARTEALKAIDEAKKLAMANLPLAGIGFDGEEVTVDGIPFPRLNLGRQVKFAIELAKLRAGELGLICVDGLEHLDIEAFEAFKAAAMEADVQLVVTRVAEGEGLEVLTYDRTS